MPTSKVDALSKWHDLHITGYKCIYLEDTRKNKKNVFTIEFDPTFVNFACPISFLSFLSGFFTILTFLKICEIGGVPQYKEK